MRVKCRSPVGHVIQVDRETIIVQVKIACRQFASKHDLRVPLSLVFNKFKMRHPGFVQMLLW